MNNSNSLANTLIQIRNKALWAPLTVIVLHWVAAARWGHEPYVDPVIHFSGGVAAAYFFWRSAECCQHYLGALKIVTLALLAFGLTTFAAVAWEMMEFLVATYNRVSMFGGQANMLRDLALGMTGAALFVASYGRYKRHGADTPG